MRPGLREPPAAGLARRRQQRGVQLWHIHIGPAAASPRATPQPQPSVLPSRLMRRRRLCRPAPPPVQHRDVHIRLFYSPLSGEHSVVINNTPFVTAPPISNVLFDTVPHFLDPRHRWRVVTASVTGELHQMCRPKAKWARTIRRDNDFLRSVANSWVNHAPFTTWLEEELTRGKPFEPLLITDPEQRLLAVAPRVLPLYPDTMHRRILYHLTDNAPEIYEFRLLNDNVVLKSGYDDFHGSLLDKLRAALANRTCIQDVGGELCEMLSLPYPPECAEAYGRFQCDQTNVPPLNNPFFAPMEIDRESLFADAFDEDTFAVARTLSVPPMTPIMERRVRSQ